MKRKKLKTIILVCVCSVLSMACGKETTTEEKEPTAIEIQTGDTVVTEKKIDDTYNQIMHNIDNGDIEGLIATLLEDGVSEKVYEQICKEDKDVFAVVMRDVLLYCEEFNDAETIVRLRTKGFVSDESFEQYWLALEYNPERNEIEESVDSYLLCEIERFMKKEENGENFLQEVYGLGLLDEAFQAELEKRLQ